MMQVQTDRVCLTTAAVDRSANHKPETCAGSSLGVAQVCLNLQIDFTVEQTGPRVLLY